MAELVLLLDHRITTWLAFFLKTARIQRGGWDLNSDSFMKVERFCFILLVAYDVVAYKDRFGMAKLIRNRLGNYSRLTDLTRFEPK